MPRFRPAWGEDEDGEQSLREWFFDPVDLGGVFGRATIGFALLTVLSTIGLVVIALSLPEQPTGDGPRLEDPSLGYVWLLSFTGAVLSVAGYTVWSFWKQRQLRAQLPDESRSTGLERPIRTLRIIAADSDDLGEHQKRVQLTVFASVVTVLFGQLPGRIWLDALQSL